MRKTRFVLVFLLAAAAMVLVATPVVAQASATSKLINQLNGGSPHVTILIIVLVGIILLYTTTKFRNNERALSTKENRRLEITWTTTTAVILFFADAASYGVLVNKNVAHQGNNIAIDDGPIIITMEIYQWDWNMYYPEENNFSSGNEIVIPKDRPVYFQVISTGVIHGFHIPELALKQDAAPGPTNTVKTVARKKGTYQGCYTEYRDVAHPQTYPTVDIVSQDECQNWLSEQQSTNSESSDSSNSITTNSTQ